MQRSIAFLLCPVVFTDIPPPASCGGGFAGEDVCEYLLTPTLHANSQSWISRKVPKHFHKRRNTGLGRAAGCLSLTTAFLLPEGMLCAIPPPQHSSGAESWLCSPALCPARGGSARRGAGPLHPPALICKDSAQKPSVKLAEKFASQACTSVLPFNFYL